MAAASSTWTDKSHGRKRRLGFESGRRTHTCVTNKDKKRGTRSGEFPLTKKRDEGDERYNHSGPGEIVRETERLTIEK